MMYLQCKKRKTTEINIRKADKGTTSVFMSLGDKKNDGQIGKLQACRTYG